MSALNGDKSRYHRERKQKIARRKKTRELVTRERAERKTESSSSTNPPRLVQV